MASAGTGMSPGADLLVGGKQPELDLEEEDAEGPEEAVVAVSHVGEGLCEIPQHLAAVRNLQALCLHANNIRRIERLDGLRHLADLNLSSNCIDRMEGLQGLAQLTSLNLASNNLVAVDGLSGLHSLRRLNLSHNYIASLQGLAALHGGQLEFLDVRNNAISSLHEFSVLAGCPNLTELLVEGGLPGNPVCQQPAYSIAITAALPQLRILDRRPVNPGEAMQYLAALHLQAFQPVQPQQSQLAAFAGQPAAAARPGSMAGSPPPSSWQMEQPAIMNAQLAQQQFAAQQAATGHSPLQKIQGMLVAASPAQCSVAAACSPSLLQLPAARQLPQSPQLRLLQQQSAQGQPKEADAEWQLAQLLEAHPHLVGSLIKALRSAEEDVCGAAAAGQVQAELSAQSGTQLSAISEPKCSSCSSMQTDMDGQSLEQLQAQVTALQDEMEALNAELEVHGQSVARAQKEAAAAVLQAAQEAERQVLNIQQQAGAAVQQAKQELISTQERCKVLEASLAEHRDTHMASSQRQQDLEYELGRAWEELERVEAALQHQRAQHELSMQQQEIQLSQARQEAQQSAAALAEAMCKREVLQQQVAEQQAALSRLQSERDASERSSCQRIEDLQRQLAASQAQLHEQQAQLQEVQARESEAREQLKQLSASLASVHGEHKAEVAALKAQHEQQLRDHASEHLAAVSASLEERDSVQRQLATTEAEFRCALQEGAQECADLRRDLEALAADGVEVRRAVQEEHQKRKDAEAMVGELTEVVQHQKLRMRALAQEKAETAARLAAMNPQELERVRSELLTLRERAGELGAIRDQLVQERRLAESLQQRLAVAQQQLVDAREDAGRQVASANAALRSGQEEAAKKLATAEAAAVEASARAEQLSEEASRLRDAVKVKEAMLDSANERIAELKSAAAAAHEAAEEARLAAEEVEEELRAREGNDSDKQHSLRAEIEAQEQVIESLERKLGEVEKRLKDAEKRAAAAEAAAAEKESVINYVGEEVERVKGMFEQKEARLAQERDTACKEAAQLRAERETLGAMVQQLEASARELTAQLQAEQARAASAAQAAARHQAEAVRGAGRVAEVECELREVLGELEQHKAAAAAKFQQLQEFVMLKMQV